MELARMRYERDRVEEAPLSASVDLEKTDAVLGAVMPLHKLADRLSGFWVMPYFLVAEKLAYTDVDGANHLNNLRFLTATYGGRYPSTLPTGLKDAMTEGWGLSAEGMKSYFMQGLQDAKASPATSWGSSLSDVRPSAENTANTESTRNTGESLRYAMSWNTLTITSGFYLYAVLNLGTSPGNLSIKGPPLLWIIRTLEREADESLAKLIEERRSDVSDESGQCPELLLWVLFMGAITVAGFHYMAAATGHIECNMPGGEATFAELEAWFAVRIRKWSRLTGVSAWDGAGGARDSLAAVVWPMQAKVEPLAKTIWDSAVQYEDAEQQ